MEQRSYMHGKWFLLLITLFIFIACSDDDVLSPPEIPEEELQVDWKQVKKFTFEDLKEAAKTLGIQALLGNKPLYEGNIQMQALKVSCKSGHPDGSDQKIDLSGVILMPPATDSLTTHPVVLALPYTYVKNTDSPTLQLTNYNAADLEAFIAFWMIKASQGYIVVIPDYPGFGDSHGQCFIPYIESEPMIRTTYDFLQAAQITLNQNYFARKKTLIVTGYSLGGYVAASFARELETNSDYNYPVDLLFVGGAPFRLKQISDLVRASDELVTPYLMPYAIWGYKKNGYPDLKVGDILNEPYASTSDTYFDGNHSNIGELFPKKVNELFTESYINATGETSTYINRILDENSVKPWKNKCDFFVIHGKNDKTVYYANAEDYVAEHKSAGGSVDFIPDLLGSDHSGSGIIYFISLTAKLPAYK
ncbi:MAG: alpha/beta fold hydrolase [Tannerella sp.]|jgi:pimeloyl-ACP methyl ester carboxylesterase|nr:alpha/beta fold hydrolase [Tannerella sp.]